MKTIDSGESYIDYFQGVSASHKGLTNHFGIRVCGGRCFAVMVADDQQPRPFGAPYQIPLQLDTLPGHLHLIVDNHLLNNPDSDLLEVLSGRKPFDDALNAPRNLQRCG